ncbi:MAG TPA: hypothetical protein VFM54_04775 [Micromonosporaceae bacterium]|nr:hypothetical protein [Micromonosporaceae bacterium]
MHNSSRSPEAEAVLRELEVLRNRVSHWGQPRWVGRADTVYGLVQRIADLAADAEGEPRRPVPRLDSDLALVDQLRVVTADLLAAGPAAHVLASAAADLAAVRRAL